MPGHREIDGKETAEQLATEGSSHPLTGPVPGLGISAQLPGWVIRDWTSRKHKEHWKSIRGQRQARGFLKNPLGKKLGKCSV